MPDFWLYGDIKLTDHQKALLDVPVGADDFIYPRKPPAATREKTLLWEGGVIPYVFDCSLSKLDLGNSKCTWIFKIFFFL